MKNKKGFTLIELLAIIVILAVIAVITVPIILNVIDNSKRGAAIDSALGYRDAIHKGFLTGLALDNNNVAPSGVYVIDSTGKLVNANGDVLSAVVSGTVPTEGWVELDKENVVAYSLRFDDYVVTKYQDTDAVAVKNGEIAENVEAREARLESERQTSAIETAKGIASSQSGTTEIIDITDGWVAFINGELKAYSIKVNEGDYTYIVTDNDVDTSNSNAVADRTTSELSSKTSAEQAILSYKVDTYVKAALAANSSLTDETAKTVSEMSSVTTNTADSGWIHFNKVNNSVVVVDYSLTYGTITANYSLLTDGNYVSTFGEARNKPSIIAIGSEVCLTETDCFKVIEINGGSATLLANNNINPSTGMQGENGQHYSVAFSGTNYWNVSGQTYPVDIYDSTKNDASGTNYSVAYYVNQYVENLQNRGINVTSGRILTKLEVQSGGIAYSYRNSGEHYWLGSANASTYVYFWFSYVSIDSYSISKYGGVRPVIYIGTSDI